MTTDFAEMKKGETVKAIKIIIVYRIRKGKIIIGSYNDDYNESCESIWA